MTRHRASGSWMSAPAITARAAGRHAGGPAKDQGCHALIRIGRDQEHHCSLPKTTTRAPVGSPTPNRDAGQRNPQ
jgi:hypothetical protein